MIGRAALILALTLAAAGAGRAFDAAGPAVHLSAPLTYFQAPVVTELTAARARALRDVPVRFGGDVGRGVTFVKAGQPDRRVPDCRRFAIAERDGFSPPTTFDIVMSGFLVRACGLLDAVIGARPARRDRIDTPRIGVRDIDRISLAALPAAPWEPGQPSAQEERRRARTSIGAFVRAQHCRVTVATALELQLRCDELLYALTELVRADVDGGGDMEIVVAPYMRSMTGSLSYPAPVVALAPTGPGGLLVPRPLTPAVGSDE